MATLGDLTELKRLIEAREAQIPWNVSAGAWLPRRLLRDPRVGSARLVSQLVDIGDPDTGYRDVCLERARMLLGEVMSPKDVGRIERQQARALRRENWAQVQDLSAHVGYSARRRGRPARVLPQPELSSASGRVRFARGLTGADRAATSRAPV